MFVFICNYKFGRYTIEYIDSEIQKFLNYKSQYINKQVKYRKMKKYNRTLYILLGYKQSQ